MGPDSGEAEGKIMKEAEGQRAEGDKRRGSSCCRATVWALYDVSSVPSLQRLSGQCPWFYSKDNRHFKLG